MEKYSRQSNKAFTLIELLVVVAIIGILSGVVLTSLNTARTKGQIASIKSNLRSMIAQAELSYDTPGNYSTACAGVQKMIDAIAGAGGVAGCYSHTADYSRWGASAKLNSDNTKNYSVSQNGIATWDTTDSGYMSWTAANTACSSAGGRLPTIEELKSLYTAYGGSPTGFMPTSNYWSGTIQSVSSNTSYYLYMLNGNITGASVAGNNYARCVR